MLSYAQRTLFFHTRIGIVESVGGKPNTSASSAEKNKNARSDKALRDKFDVGMRCTQQSNELIIQHEAKERNADKKSARENK
jgi:hypothetical protein